jgi:hypothetical protein
MRKENKQFLLVILLLFTFLFTGVFIGYNIGLEPLRLEMEKRELVFCEPVYPPFQEPYAVPVNITWDDLEAYNNGK